MNRLPQCRAAALRPCRGAGRDLLWPADGQG
jgi:hypothetical protein